MRSRLSSADGISQLMQGRCEARRRNRAVIFTARVSETVEQWYELGVGDQASTAASPTPSGWRSRHRPPGQGEQQFAGWES